MHTDTKFKFTRAEATAWIGAAKSGVKFHAHVSMDRARADSDDMELAACRATVGLSRTSAAEMVKNYLSDYTEQSGRRIPCCEHRVGNYIAYWIG